VAVGAEEAALRCHVQQAHGEAGAPWFEPSPVEERRESARESSLAGLAPDCGPGRGSDCCQSRLSGSAAPGGCAVHRTAAHPTFEGHRKRT